MGLQLTTKVYRRRFRQPLRTAHGRWGWRVGLIVRIQDSAGRVGFGEIAPLPEFGSESLTAAQAFCASQAESVLNHYATTPGGQPSLAIPDCLSATQFGLATALAQLRSGEATGMGYSFGSESVAICGLLPAGAGAFTRWRSLWEQGTRTFKWKLGVNPVATEMADLEALIQVLPASARLRLDANGGLTVPEAEHWLAQCDRLNATPTTATIEYLEQPLPPTQVEAMQQLGERFRTAIALDESVATLDQLEEHHQRGWPGIWVVKPAIAGFPSRLRQFWQQHSPRLVFSSVFETVVGRQAALALAIEYAQSTPITPPLALGFGTLGWFEDDWDTLTPPQLWDCL